MARRPTRAERCRMGRHTPVASTAGDGEGDVHRAVCRYCGAPIMRTRATRIWFLATMLS